MAEHGGAPAEVALNTKLVPNYASFYGESLMPPSDEGKQLTPQEFQEQFPVRYDVWNTLSQSMLGHSDTGISLNNADHIQTIKTRLHVLNQLDRYITTHHLGENGRTLRERQMTVFEDIRNHLEQGETSGYIKLPTGSGKTVIFTELAEATDLKTLIVVPRQLLVDQTAKRFEQFAPNMEVGKVYADAKERGRQVEITTYDSMMSGIKNGLIDPKQYDLVVLDEVHKGLSKPRQEAIQQFTNAVKLGFTATPNYSETKKVGNVLGKEIHAMTVREAVEEGMLSPLSVYLVRTKTDITNVKVTSGGDYDQDELEQAINNKERNMATVQTYQELMKDPANKGQLSIAYCVGVQHAKDLASEFQKVGVAAGVVYGGQDKKERQQMLKNYEDGKIQILCNAKLLIEGFDEPKTGIILNVAPTASVVDAEQRGGRGLRLDPNNPNKHAIIVDIIDQTSSRGFTSVTFAQIVDGAYIYPSSSNSSSSSNGHRSQITPQIHVEGVEVITDPEEVMRIAKEELMPSEVETVKEGELILGSSLDTIFIGGWTKISPIAERIVNEIAGDHPEYFVDRIDVNGRRVRIVTAEGKNTFIERMQAEGIKLKPENKLDNVKEGEITLSGKPLEGLFATTKKKILRLLPSVVQELKKINPEFVAQRRNGVHTIEVVTEAGREEFIRRVKEEGIALRQEIAFEKIKDNELPINGTLNSVFHGGRDKVLSQAVQVAKKLINDYPDAVVTRRIGGVNSMVVKPEYKDEFSKRMQEAGINLRPQNIPQDIKEDDIYPNDDTVHKLFIGDQQNFMGVVKQIVGQLAIDHPEYIETRLNGVGSIVQVVTALGKEEFLKRAREASLIVRSEILMEPPQADEIVLSNKALFKVFVGHQGKIKILRDMVVNQIRNEHPEWVVNRWLKTRQVEVITSEGREEFIKRMQEAGINVR